MYSCNALALSAATAQPINGSLPYVTFDGGKTKLTSTRSLLEIKLPDGTVITPDNNDSTFEKPIIFHKSGGTFSDIEAIVPPEKVDDILFSELVSGPYNYWGDDDGDGKGNEGIIATGRFNITVVDKEGFVLDRYNKELKNPRKAVLDICYAPYTLKLASGGGTLSTQYGFPKSRSYPAEDWVNYYIQPSGPAKICYAKPPYLNSAHYLGPKYMTNQRGFILQSDTSLWENFPTTAAGNFYFDLDIGGVSSSLLTWNTVTKDGITATVTPAPNSKTNMRVTFTGPVATNAQKVASQPGRIGVPNLPLTFELVGKNRDGYPVLKYGFVLKQWFVSRGNVYSSDDEAKSWCSSLGYRLIKAKDVTNSFRNDYPSHQYVETAKPTSTAYVTSEIRIGGGLFSEWPGIMKINGVDEVGFFRTDDTIPRSAENDSDRIRVDVLSGQGTYEGHPFELNDKISTLCVYP